MVKKWYFEDFKVGEKRQYGNHTVSENEIIEFAKKYDPQPFHIDPDAAQKTMFGGLIASGWHTASMHMRMIVENLMEGGTSLGSPGLNSLKWLKPVRPGDTLRAEVEILDKRRSRTKPLGYITMKHRLFNQRDDVVMEMEGLVMFPLREKPNPPQTRKG